MVGRTDTTLYIAFRGTNGAQDYDDWVQLSPFDRSRSDHYDLFLPLFDALTTYLQSHSEITKISLAGHSLGASMAQYLYTSGFFQNIAIEDTIFSNPGYEIDLRPDNVNGRAILDFLLDGDVIEPARNFLSSEVKGDLNRVHWVGVGDSLSAIEIHTVLNYQKVMQFLWAESLIDYNFSTSVFWNVAYGGRGFNDLTVGVVTSQVNDVAQFISIGTADDILVGSKIYSELFSSYTYFSDVIIGGSGNDRLYGEGGGDLLYGGTDSDSLYGGSGADSLFGGIGQDFLQGGAGIDVLDGGGENDDLRGEVASDTVFGKDGDDSLFGGRGADSLYGGSGLDDLRGEDGMDYMDGGDDADTLYGGKNSDTMFGGAGDDTIMGQSGVDILFGGDGSDLFRFYVASDSSVAAGVDEIRDFAAGGGIVIGPSILASGPSDIIDLSAIDAITRTKLINDSFHFDGQHPDPTILGIGSSGIVGNVWYEQRGGFTWVLANIQGDGTPELTIKLAGTIDLTIDNFIL